MSVRQFMALCLTHPEHGYYTTRDPFGRAGDFVTAPEVSQIFGELIGLWAAAVWRLIGQPRDVRLVELGPGRGTMMADVLRASHVVPGFRAALKVDLVEISPALRSRQEETLKGFDVPMQWHDTLEDVPDGPSITLANEFFDALPVHQAVKQLNGWYERMVTLDDEGNFAFSIADEPLPLFEQFLPRAVRDAPLGATFEWRPDNLALEIGRRAARFNGAALVIDYGHTASAAGETLQAVGMIGHGVFAPGDRIALSESKALFGVELAGPADSVKVTIRDPAGAVVRTLDYGRMEPGSHPMHWDGKTDKGDVAADGAYIFEVQAVRAGEKARAATLGFGDVVSVTTGPQGVRLNVPGVGDISLEDVRQVI